MVKLRKEPLLALSQSQKQEPSTSGTLDVLSLRSLAYFCEYGNYPMAGCYFVLYCVEQPDIAIRSRTFWQANLVDKPTEETDHSYR